jgi:uncharacterized protein
MIKPNNPFLISGYLGATYFCNRKKETKSIIAALENGRNVTLISLRRMGKTGLIKHAFQQIKTKKVSLIYVDLLHTTDMQTMVKEFAKATINQLSLGVMKSSFQKITTLFGSLRPTFSVDPVSGAPSVEIDVQKGKQSTKTLEEILYHLESHSAQVIVAFDEFQAITSYPEKNVEALLRGLIQHLNNVRFIYSGSQKHILTNMFGDSKRPFYQSSQFLALESIPVEDYTPFIRAHFKEASISIEVSEIAFILDWTYCHTFYVQFFCNKLFDLKMTDSKATIYQAVEKIFEENEAVFTSFRSLLTPPQAQLLTAIAKNGWVLKPTSKEFLSRYGLTSSAVQRTLPALLQKEFLTTEKNGYRVYDVFFGRWLATNY